jgi:hypothetical protein
VESIVEWDVVVVGGINSDYLVRGRELPAPGSSLDGDVFLAAPGGKGANAAVAASRLGARTAIIGRVGHDERGRALLDSLVEEGVHATRVDIDDEAVTGAAVIQVDESGQKQILAALGANLRLGVEHIEAAAGLIRASRVLLMQLEVPTECVAAAARIARDARVRIVLDVPGMRSPRCSRLLLPKVSPWRMPDDSPVVQRLLRRRSSVPRPDCRGGRSWIGFCARYPPRPRADIEHEAPMAPRAPCQLLRVFEIEPSAVAGRLLVDTMILDHGNRVSLRR